MRCKFVVKCMAEGEDFICGNEAVSFTVLGRSVLLCWCEEHRNRSLIQGERPIDEHEWMAMAAMEAVHNS